jgi:hypothetical protein
VRRRFVVCARVLSAHAHHPGSEVFDEVVAFAKKAGLYEPQAGIEDKNGFLKSRLDYLENYGRSEKTRVQLLPDGAPYCFYFVIETRNSAGEWERLFNGGLLFHGPHDGLGSGAGPTFACTLTPTIGWSIHT